MKLLCEIAERTLGSFLTAFACLGMFLTGCMIGNVFFDGVTETDMWNIVVVSGVLAFFGMRLLLKLRLERILIIADELEFEENEEAKELWEHLKV